MTTAYHCLLAAAILPIICAGIAKGGAKDFDNGAPRAWLNQRSGYRARANAAQANSFEAFAFFAAAVIAAQTSSANATGGQQIWIDGLALGFLFVRFAYIACYLADKPTLRSVMWTLGLGLTIGILFRA